MEDENWEREQKRNLISTLKYKFKLLAGRFKVKSIGILKIFKPRADSLLVARAIAKKLKKRMAFRKVLYQCKRNLKTISAVKGFKIQLAGRLNGVEIARTEWIHGGRLPLQTLKANISYISYPANTRYGIIGIKVWIFKR